MAPPFVKFWPGWNRPIHRGWLGDHKTVIGFTAGVLGGLLVAYLQSRVEIGVERLWRADAWLAIGFAQGLGAMSGDAGKSFFKRRLGIPPGGRWIPADQIDFVVGALIPLAFLVELSVTDVILVIVFTFVADIAVNHASYRAGIRDTKW